MSAIETHPNGTIVTVCTQCHNYIRFDMWHEEDREQHKRAFASGKAICVDCRGERQVQQGGK